MKTLSANGILSEFVRPIAVVVVFVGMAIAACSAIWLHQSRTSGARAQFNLEVERIATEVTRRIELPVYGLQGLKGLYASSADVTRTHFRDYVLATDVAKEYLGLRGFGFIDRVMRPEVDSFVRAENALGASGFAVRQLKDAGHDDLYVIKYIEPAERNPGAAGLDVGSEPNRREALLRAIDSGSPTLSRSIVLVQDQHKARGALLYSPIYRNGSAPSTPQERRAALVGVLFASLAYGDLLESVLKTLGAQVSFELLDSTLEATDPAPIFAAGVAPKGDDGYEPLFTGIRTLTVANHTVTLQVSSTPEFEAAQSSTLPWLVFAGMSLASLLLALVILQQAAARVRAENLAEELTVDLERLAQVARSTSNAVVITDMAHRITWVNEGFERISGYSAEEAVGRALGELLQFERTDPETIGRLRDALEARSTFRGEILNRGKDGREYWLEIEIQSLHDTHGALTGFMAIESDVTERVHAAAAMRTLEADLSDKNALFVTVLKNLPCGLSVFDGDLNMVQANSEFRRLLGLPDTLFEGPVTRFEDIIRHNALRGDYGSGDIEPTVQAMVERARGPATPHCFERMLPNGIWVEIRGGPMPGGGFITTYTDVTARRSAEAEVTRSTQLLRGSIEALDDAFALFDPDDRLVLCNQRYRELYPLCADMMVPGNTFEQIVRAGAERGQYAGVVGRVDEWVAERLTIHRNPTAPLTQRQGDGRILRVVERRMPDGHTVGFRSDITELTRATEDAQAASRAKSQFLANMSHEIRTPMNAILGMLSLLRKTEMTTRQADYAGKTESAARSLLGILNEILDFSKIEAGKMDLDPQPFRSDELMRELSVILSANLGAKPIEVLFDVDPGLPRALVGDSMRLKQVLINLAGNAIKFTERGEVTVSVSVAERTAEAVSVQIAVQDTGIGIAPENLARIFSGFTQAEASTTRRFGGTGLGVAISQRLVALMGGELKLESELGRGSRFHFTITLPVAAAPDAEPPRVLEGPLRALVVDDNPQAREILHRMTESLGWAVDAAESGEQALQLMQERADAGLTYQAVFVDWQMPGIDGWETSRRIRMLGPQGPETLVIMVTAHGRETLASRSDADQAMLDEFLVKPVTASMLFDAVVDARAARAQPSLSGRRVAVDRSERLPGVRLLLVEDNLNNQQVARELLEAEGAVVQIANHGQEALDVLSANGAAFDVVLMDLQMPVMDGLTATRRIRGELGLATLPVIAMTANAMASDREECLAAGMNEHVGKPFDLDRLVAVIRRSAGLAEAPASRKKDVAAPPPGLPPGVLEAADAAGVDIATAIERMGGKPDLYRRMLRSFIADLLRIPGRASSALDAGDVKTATRVLHTLKGLAATLGANALASVASISEAHLAANLEPGQRQQAVRTACDAVQAALPGLEALIQILEPAQATEPRPVTSARADPAAALQALRAISVQLRDADMAATDAVVRLRNCFGDMLGAPLEQLDAAVGALDFDAASRLCEELMARLSTAPSPGEDQTRLAEVEPTWTRA